MSESAIGHTGFTGTSLWIDPERDRYFVLLTNRVYGDGTLEQIREVRRAFHDGLAAF
jgi:CubicO group peptidase (beta-lactamase class C family)